MGQFLGFGNGGDGDATISGTDAPNDTSFSGTSGATTGTGATGLTVAANAIALVHQSRGTGAGNWELLQIVSYVSGTGVFTFATPLVNTYTDSGASQAQLIVLKQYASVVISSTLNAKSWDGNVGGIVAFLCSGKVTVSSSLVGSNSGYFYGAPSSIPSQCGEGTSGAQADQQTPNGNGGGGAGGSLFGGGGGANATDGAGGFPSPASGGGYAGLASGNSDLSTMTFGGGGGASTGGNARGGKAGGIICFWAGSLEVTGAIANAGENGANADSGNNGGGGGGAGGSIRIVTRSGIIGSNLITAPGGTGGAPSGTGYYGGSGSDGRIAIHTCSLSGTTNPSNNGTVGGHSFCAGGMGIL